MKFKSVESKNSNKLDYDQYYTPYDVMEYCVNKALDIIKDLGYEISEFLEPSAGEGAFLVEILNQKLDYVDKISSKTNWTVNALWALMSVYGIELLQDNLIVARSRMIEVVAKHYKKFLGKDLSHRTDFYRATNFVIKTNIVQGNSLTYKNYNDDLIRFSDWQPIDKNQVKRETFTFKSMFDGSDDGQIDEQLDLFHLDEPASTIEYAVCPVTKIYKEEKTK